MSTTFEWLCDALAEEYRIDRDQLRPETALEDIGLDSLAVAELLFKVEDAFKITLPPQAVPLTTLADVVGYIDTLVLARCDDAAAPADEAAPVAAPAKS